MDKLEPSDLGVAEDELRNLRHPLCVPVVAGKSEDSFEITMFVLPKGGGIPLHDHPNSEWPCCCHIYICRFKLFPLPSHPTPPMPRAFVARIGFSNPEWRLAYFYRVLALPNCSSEGFVEILPVSRAVAFSAHIGEKTRSHSSNEEHSSNGEQLCQTVLYPS